MSLNHSIGPAPVPPEKAIPESGEDEDPDHYDASKDRDERRIDRGRLAHGEPRDFHLERDENDDRQDDEPEAVSEELAERPFMPTGGVAMAFLGRPLPVGLLPA